MARNMTRQGAERLAERLKELGFSPTNYKEDDTIPMYAIRKEGERNIGEWCVLAKVNFYRGMAQKFWVVVEMSVYKYAGGETLNTLKAQTTVSSVDEFNTLYLSRKRLLDIKDYFYFDDK